MNPQELAEKLRDMAEVCLATQKEEKNGNLLVGLTVEELFTIANALDGPEGLTSNPATDEEFN